MARILVVSPCEPPPDGIARHTGHLVAAWDSAGHSVLVVAPGKHRGLEDVEHVGTRATIARVLRQMPRRRTLDHIVAFEPDVVFVQFAVAALNVNLWSVRNLCQRFSSEGVPVVVAYHEPAREYDLLGVVTRSIYKSYARLTDVPIVFSSAGGQALLDNGLFNEVIEVPHGTLEVATINDDDVRRVRRLYQLEKPFVLALGFTSADKGTDVLLAAASAITAERDGDVQFLIAGSPRIRRGVFWIMGRRDARFQQRLESQAKKLANVNITFSGYVADQDVAPLLFAADVVALPYRSITQSGIANLALASRSVVVCSDLPGLRSDLGDAAKYVAPGDSSELAGEIASLLDGENSAERLRMRTLSEHRALANSFSKVAEQILSAGLSSGKPGPSH
ncbi:MAG: glycosyltransferase family 4 protein [Acidimicrobiales bacterium]